MPCFICKNEDRNCLTGDGACWDKEACEYRADLSHPEEIRSCSTTDVEQMYVALHKILAITGHDHSNPIHEIVIDSLPYRGAASG